MQGVLEEIADQSEIDWSTKDWPKMGRMRSPAMIFGQGWIASKILRQCLTKGELLNGQAPIV